MSLQQDFMEYKKNSNQNIILVENKEIIFDLLINNKNSSTWVQDEIKGTLLYQLAYISPSSLGDKSTILVCDKETVKEFQEKIKINHPIIDHLEAAIALHEIRSLRIGQAVYNCTPSDLLEKAKESKNFEDVDCFYNDDNCYAYLALVYGQDVINQHWSIFNLEQYK